MALVTVTVAVVVAVCRKLGLQVHPIVAGARELLVLIETVEGFWQLRLIMDM